MKIQALVAALPLVRAHNDVVKVWTHRKRTAEETSASIRTLVANEFVSQVLVIGVVGERK